MDTRQITTKLEMLPQDLKKEALDYIEFLILKHEKDVKKDKFSFDWAGGLSDLKERYSAVELQHKASEWR